jgi:hypothetical protein
MRTFTIYSSLQILSGRLKARKIWAEHVECNTEKRKYVEVFGDKLRRGKPVWKFQT